MKNGKADGLVALPQIALCRCGRSAMKPFCDGTHTRNRFDDAKDPQRLSDRQNTYEGLQLTVLDNRGTCAHSGYRSGLKPWIPCSVVACGTWRTTVLVTAESGQRLAESGDRLLI